MSDQNTTGSPIAVTLVSKDLADQLALASRSLNGYLPIGPGISPVELFRNLGWADPRLRSNGSYWMTVIVVNYFDKPLIQVGQSLNQGSQVGYPIESDLAGAYVSGVEPDFPDFGGRPGNALTATQIPAATPDPLHPGETLYGVGCYQFSQSGYYGAEGAMAYTIGEGGNPFGIAFAAPYKSVWYPSLASGCAVAASLSPYANHLDAFYKAVDPSKGQNTPSDSNSTVSLHASLSHIHANQKSYDDPQECVVVSVMPN